MKHILPWYRSYFECAVQTGLNPCEQVALKWSDIDDKYIHIERTIHDYNSITTATIDIGGQYNFLI